MIVERIGAMDKIDNTVKKILHDHGYETVKLLESMPKERIFGLAADIFDQLSDSTRLRILWLLCHSEECVGDIAAAIDMSAPAVSHHLRTLRQAGIISSRRVGKEVLYTLEKSPKAQLIHKMIDDVFEMNCPREEIKLEDL